LGGCLEIRIVLPLTMAEHVDHVELIFGIDAERNSGSNGGGPLQKIVANLWTEFAARRRDALIAYGNELQPNL